MDTIFSTSFRVLLVVFLFIHTVSASRLIVKHKRDNKNKPDNQDLSIGSLLLNQF